MLQIDPGLAFPCLAGTNTKWATDTPGNNGGDGGQPNRVADP